MHGKNCTCVACYMTKSSPQPQPDDSHVDRLVMPIMLADGKKWDRTIPFARLDEDQAKKNHGQTLRQLAERGGLAPSEAIAIINGGGWKPVPDKIGLEILNHIFYATAKA